MSIIKKGIEYSLSGTYGYCSNLCKLDTDKIISAYSNSNTTALKIGTINNNTISYSSEYIVDSLDKADHISVTSLSNSSFVIAYDSFIGGYKKIRACTISGNTVTLGTEYTLESSFGDVIVEKLTSSTFVVCYSDKCKIGTVSGTTISFGSEYDFTDLSSTYKSLKVINSTSFIISCSNIARIGTVSGTTITFGSEYDFSNNTIYDKKIILIDSTHFCIFFRNTSLDDNGYYVIGTISGTAISYIDPILFNNSFTNYLSADIYNNKLLLFYRSSGSSSVEVYAGTISTNSIIFENIKKISNDFYITSTISMDGYFVIAYGSSTKNMIISLLDSPLPTFYNN